MTPPRRPEPALERNGHIGQPGALELMPRLCPMQISGRRFWPFCAGVCIDNRHVRNEAIATFWKSLNKSRILSRVP